MNEASLTSKNDNPTYWHHLSQMAVIRCSSWVANILSVCMGLSLLGLTYLVVFKGEEKLALLIALFGQVAQIVQSAIQGNNPSPIQAQRRADNPPSGTPADPITAEVTNTPGKDLEVTEAKGNEGGFEPNLKNGPNDD